MKTLPCHPCPHASACCSWGTDLTLAEAVAVAREHGIEALTVGEDGFRTRVVDGACVFLSSNRCTIHDKAYYPGVCRGFPWTDETGASYEGDVTICPELKA